MTSLGVRHGMVVYGKDKLDEISLSAPTKVCEIKDGWFKLYGGAEKAALSTCQSPQKGEM
jgi:anthranilate phosphoribosyltransferase